MLFSLHIEVAHKLAGLAPSAYFEYATGLSRMTYQRGRAYEALAALVEEGQTPNFSLLLHMMRRRISTEAVSCNTKIPSGISAIMAYGLGFPSEHCRPATRELVAQLDASDKYLCSLRDSDVEKFLRELGPDSQLGPAYCQPLAVSGFRYPPLALSDDERTALKLALTRRAHMAMSFLAAMDHELGQWSSDVIGVVPMGQCSRFAVLLARPEAATRERWRPRDPIARLVDFIGSAGFRNRNGQWPQNVPTVAEMGLRAELSGSVSGDGSRFVQALRAGKHPMTRRAFQTLVQSQFWMPDLPREVLDVAADRTEPYLVAAHLLTLLMPDHPQAKGHLDRAGWREAYIGWWAHHAQYESPAEASDGPAPPDWLLDP